MRKKLLFILLCMVLITASSLIITSIISEDKASSKTRLVTSFYPIYIIATNLVEGIEDIEVVNLTEYETGCLHDYQLTTRDMKRLENADLIIMNGGGMEGFVEDIFDSYPNIPVIDSSTGIPLLSGTSHSHEEDDGHNHDHSHEYNAHIWMNMDYYIKQVENVAKELSELYPSYTRIFETNSMKYIEEIRVLQEEYKSRLAGYKEIPIILFHDAFEYLADEMGLNVIHIISMDENSYLSAAQIKEIIDKINIYNVEMLLTEEQYSVTVAETISSETDSRVYIVDSIVTGPEEKDAYIKGMKNNLEILEAAYEEVLGQSK
ncbi:MAG: zinc ABC transporter substrate-binding protein [Clostridiales bacterium]|nr:zinc ABC transporter substrate-binding protein [Clostridiales bacterium]